MYNPKNLNEVCVQATHIESKGKDSANNYSKNPFKLKERHIKGRGKVITKPLLRNTMRIPHVPIATRDMIFQND